MDTTKRNREEPPRRPRQEPVSSPRKQPSAQGPNRRPRPQEETQGSRRPEQPRKAPQEPGRQSPQSESRETARPGEETPRRREPEPRQPKKQSPARQAAKGPNSGKGAVRPAKAPAQTRRSARRSEQPDDLSAKKRAYGNSKPKKKSSFAILGQAISATAKESAQRRRTRLEREGKRSRNDASKEPLPAVIYTQPKAFNRDRLLVQLITVTAVVVAFVVGLSVFFKVENIRVSGAEVYTAWAVQEASGIKTGDSLLTFSRFRAGAQIKANLPYVEKVSFGIRLPDTVNIIIEEEDVVYAIKDQDEQWWLINANGRVVDQANKGQASNYTQILGVALDHPLQDQTAVAVEAQIVAQNPETDPTAESTEAVVPVNTVSGEQKLRMALQIVQALEDNDIVGEAASINLAQTQSITLWYGTRYQVNLGDSSNLEYKIACMNSVIMEMQEYQSGILDCSFTVWPDQVGYTPFS